MQQQQQQQQQDLQEQQHKHSRLHLEIPHSRLTLLPWFQSRQQHASLLPWSKDQEQGSCLGKRAFLLFQMAAFQRMHLMMHADGMVPLMVRGSKVGVMMEFRLPGMAVGVPS